MTEKEETQYTKQMEAMLLVCHNKIGQLSKDLDELEAYYVPHFELGHYKGSKFICLTTPSLFFCQINATDFERYRFEAETSVSSVTNTLLQKVTRTEFVLKVHIYERIILGTDGKDWWFRTEEHNSEIFQILPKHCLQVLDELEAVSKKFLRKKYKNLAQRIGIVTNVDEIRKFCQMCKSFILKH